VPDSRSFTIDESSGSFAFSSGKSYFAAFELPRYSSPYSITIKSYMMGDHMESAYIFLPAVIFMDEKYVVTRMLEDFSVLSKTGFFETSGIRWKFEGKVHVTRENANERYVVILTTDKMLGGKTAVASPVFIPSSCLEWWVFCRQGERKRFLFRILRLGS
jgi:maltose operon protein